MRVAKPERWFDFRRSTRGRRNEGAAARSVGHVADALRVERGQLAVRDPAFDGRRAFRARERDLMTMKQIVESQCAPLWS